MDKKHFKLLAKKWAYKLRENVQDIEQEIFAFYLSRESEGKSLDIFMPGHEGALYELLKHKVRGNNLESLGGSGKRHGGAGDDDDMGEFDIPDGIDVPEEADEQLELRLQFERMFCHELDQIDELNHLAGTDLGDAFGFTGANGRAVLSQLKRQIIAGAQKRFNAKSQVAKSPARGQDRQQVARV